jgi:hypothetical protein
MNKTSNPTGRIEVAGDCACYRPAGRTTMEGAVELIDQAIAFARDSEIPKLLVNVVELTGYPAPTLPERYFNARRWAATSRGSVQMALVMRPEMFDPQKFGVIVARNSGLNAEVFASESEALAWLRSAPDK